MEENISNQNQEENSNSENPNADKEQANSNDLKASTQSAERNDATTKKENTQVFWGSVDEYLYNTGINNLSKYLASDANRYLKAQVFDNDILLNNNFRLRDSTLDNQLKLADEINELRRKLKKSAEELKNTQADRENKIAEFEKLTNELTAKEKTNHILTRISEEGRKKLLDSEEFKGLFKNSNKCDTVVVSIDIRRSTELMLKARTPELFSKFITEL
ncbi:MAG: hypothetical protein ACTHMD_11585, partial [Flavisolibacter sp.]